MPILKKSKKHNRDSARCPRTRSEWKEAVLDFIVDVVIIFMLVFLIIRPFVISPFQVKQQSMEPNVHDSEYILVGKLPYNPIIGWADYARGDIVVFRPSVNPENYLIKRVIGLPGEQLKVEGGWVWLRDSETGEYSQIEESYLSETNLGNTCMTNSACSPAGKQIVAEFTVPAGKYLVFGDNRVASRDARTCFRGRCEDESERYISRSDIEGEAWTVFFPLQQLRLLGE